MLTKPRPRHSKRRPSRRRRKVFNRIVENDLIRQLSYEEYREKVRNVYGGPKGAMLATCSMLSLHVPLGERLFRERKFDLRGARNILDVGSGAGQKGLVGRIEFIASDTPFLDFESEHFTGQVDHAVTRDALQTGRHLWSVQHAIAQ